MAQKIVPVTGPKWRRQNGESSLTRANDCFAGPSPESVWQQGAGGLDG